MMQLQSAPGACPSINIAGTEYAPNADGFIEITDERHITAAKENGFTEAEPIHTETQGE